MIDAHQHFWRLDHDRFDFAWLNTPEHAPICRNYLPQDLVPHLQAAGVSQSVFVQTQHDLEENRWALELADKHPFIAGVVGWVDLASEECEDQIAEFKEHRKFVGVRHLTQGESDEDFIVRSNVLRGLRILQKHGIPFDLLFYVQHLKHAVTLAGELPELPMVIDHLAKPNIKLGQLEEGQFKDWKKDLLAAAAFPNVHCKLSGMVTEADWRDWKPADLKPYVETALEAFGPSRCMFGSDWPVCELAAGYQQVVQALRATLGDISESEKQQIFGGTAARYYGLTQSVAPPA